MRNIFRRMLTVAWVRGDPAKLCFRLYAKGPNEKPRHRLVSFFLERYVNLVRSCEETFPRAAKFYKIFSTGIKEFKDDSLLLFNAYKKLSFDGIYCLSRKELEVYHEMPRNIVKLSPFIIAATLPFGATLFAVGFMFPKVALSHHFWSDVQKNEFALIDHKKRLQHYGSVVSCLEAQTKLIKCQTHQHHIVTILEGLRSGITPTVDEIIGCKEIFQESPYSLRSLGSAHTSSLLKLYRLHRRWGRKRRLEQHAELIKAMDSAIMAEGGLLALTPYELQRASFFRGLNPNNMKEEDVKLWLNNWLAISREMDETSYSLLLHCPVLLGYNEPTNVALIEGYRK